MESPKQIVIEVENERLLLTRFETLSLVDAVSDAVQEIGKKILKNSGMGGHDYYTDKLNAYLNIHYKLRLVLGEAEDDGRELLHWEGAE